MISVTTLIDTLDKPGLLYWANKIGLEGINLRDYYKKTSSEGSKSHNKVELFLTEGIEFEGCEKLDNSLKGFEVLHVEKEINNGFIIGRIDLVLKKDDIIYVVDFKRNKRIYLKTKLQLSCYKHMFKADKIAFINSDKLELEIVDIDTKPYWTICKHLYKINELLTLTNESL